MCICVVTVLLITKFPLTRRRDMWSEIGVRDVWTHTRQLST